MVLPKNHTSRLRLNVWYTFTCRSSCQRFGGDRKCHQSAGESKPYLVRTILLVNHGCYCAASCFSPHFCYARYLQKTICKLKTLWLTPRSSRSLHSLGLAAYGVQPLNSNVRPHSETPSNDRFRRSEGRTSIRSAPRAGVDASADSSRLTGRVSADTCRNRQRSWLAPLATPIHALVVCDHLLATGSHCLNSARNSFPQARMKESPLQLTRLRWSYAHPVASGPHERPNDSFKPKPLRGSA